MWVMRGRRLVQDGTRRVVIIVMSNSWRKGRWTCASLDGYRGEQEELPVLRDPGTDKKSGGSGTGVQRRE